MTKQRQLINKIKDSLNAARVPRYVQRKGPRRYETAELVLGLAIREAYRLSYRQAADFLLEYYSLNMHFTTLQKASARLPLWFWQGILRATATITSMIAAIDGTGYTRVNPSEHYLHRIDAKRPQVPVKLSILCDVDTRTILSARVRVRPAHDIKDVHSLIRHANNKPFVVVMDKGYDSETLHEWFDQQGIWSISPPRQGCRRGRHRKQLRDHFPDAEYAQRNIVEAIFKRLKLRHGGYVRSHSARTVRAELFIRLILHNIRTNIQRYFLQSQVHKYFYKHLFSYLYIKHSEVET